MRMLTRELVQEVNRVVSRQKTVADALRMLNMTKESDYKWFWQLVQKVRKNEIAWPPSLSRPVSESHH